MASFKIAIARPVVHVHRKSTCPTVTRCEVLQTDNTAEFQAQGSFVAPANVQPIMYQKRLRKILNSYRNGNLPSTNIFKIVMIAQCILPLLSWPGSISTLRRRTKYPFLFVTSQAILYSASLLIITKTTLLLSAFVFLAALHVDKISAPMKKLTHTAHVLLANLEVFLSDLSARSNIPGIRTYLDEYVDALLASLERQIQADTVGSVLGDKFSSTDDPPKSKQLVPIRTSTHICLDSPGDVQVRNVLKRRLDAMYLEFDEEGWLLLPSAGSDPKQENLKHLHGVPVVPISHRL